MAVHTRILPTPTDTPYPLGRHVEHDDASRDYQFRGVGAPLDLDVKWSFSKPVLNQWNYNSCVGNTIMQFFNTDWAADARAAKKVSWYTERAALNCYHLATIADGVNTDYFPPNDNGTTALGGAKAAQQLGLIDRYEHAFDFDTFRAALSHQPVCVGTAWTQSMFSPDSSGLVKVGELNDSTILGGHEYLALEILYSIRALTFLSSWGPDFGVRGTFRVSFDDFEALLAAEGDVLVPHPVGVT